MKKYLWLVCAVILFAAPMARAQDVSGGPGVNLGGVFLPDARNNLGIYIYTPTDYGAFCDSNGTTGTDDSTAINAMFNAIRTAARPFHVTAPQNKTCFIGSTINATGINAAQDGPFAGSVIEMKLDCGTNGTPCVDALSSRGIDWEYIYIKGETTNSPSFGLQVGRISAANADIHYFNRPIINGKFTVAPFYNFASELITFNAPTFTNTSIAANTYGLVQDGYNHFNITSAFVTQTLATDTAQSFNENTFIGGWYGNAATTGAPIWLGNTARHRWIGGYAASALAPNCVQLYQTGTQSNRQLDMDIHCETAAVTDVFLLTGPQTAPGLPGFRFRDHSPFASNSVLKTDTGIITVAAPDMDIRVNDFASGGGNSVKLFNDASFWTVSGRIELPNILNWTPPLAFTGDLCTGLTTSISCIKTTSTISPTPAATIATSASQASGGSTLLPFASTTGAVAGQVVQGTSVALGTQVASIVSTASRTQTANGSFLTGQPVIPMNPTGSFAVGQQCRDTTKPSAIGDGNVILTIQANVSITLTSNVTAASQGAADSITCDPVVTLSQTTTGTVGAAASINFITNATSLTASSAVYNRGDQSNEGNLLVGGIVKSSVIGASNAVAVAVGNNLGTGLFAVTSGQTLCSSGNGTLGMCWNGSGVSQAFVGLEVAGAQTYVAGRAALGGSSTLGGIYSGSGSTYDVVLENKNAAQTFGILTGTTTNQFGTAAGVPAHISAAQATPPALTSCGGGSPAITGTDTAGIVTMGTTATGCIITFNVAYSTAPVCTVTWIATPLASQSYVTSTTAITLTQTSTSSNKVQYICVGQSGG